MRGFVSTVTSRRFAKLTDHALEMLGSLAIQQVIFRGQLECVFRVKIILVSRSVFRREPDALLT